jgi:riboflavin biosynthesis pyrimidine reductase
MRVLRAADDTDPLVAYDVERGPVRDRPWVLVNMVASVDGGTAVKGVSGGLASEADRRLFFALRGLADVILVGAQTVRAEGYGPARLDDAVQARRRQRGQDELPTIAVVTATLGLDWTSRLFTESARPPVVVAPAGADPEALARAGEVADVLVAGDDRVDLAEALRRLGQRGTRVVLCEGGPRLNAELLQAGAIDELCLTLSPGLVGVGGGNRITDGVLLDELVGLRLASLLEEDGFLFLRYLVGGGGPST